MSGRGGLGVGGLGAVVGCGGWCKSARSSSTDPEPAIRTPRCGGKGKADAQTAAGADRSQGGCCAAWHIGSSPPGKAVGGRPAGSGPGPHPRRRGLPVRKAFSPSRACTCPQRESSLSSFSLPLSGCFSLWLQQGSSKERARGGPAGSCWGDQRQPKQRKPLRPTKSGRPRNGMYASTPHRSKTSKQKRRGARLGEGASLLLASGRRPSVSESSERGVVSPSPETGKDLGGGVAG